ncbi:RNA polymerase sigma factor SigJ [Salininema proteolyticum]|uniref:RNA polymerase sigma factor SigJ n=1 Tax=Salininema proteolyticum TaxID=1607685 RepID=A0ABV8TZV7_9ACTN
MNEQKHDAKAELAETYQSLRPRLVGVAYGLLGTVTEAEDAVQEAWIRLQNSDAERIEDVTAWLVTTTSRLALDMLRSVRRKRESYVGPWLPEPVETAPDPADSLSLADSLSWAMLVVLETLSPAERAAFVLHDVFSLSFPEVGKALGRSTESCRKLAARARAHVRERRTRFDVDPGEHRRITEAFARAAGEGDLDALMDLLAPDAVLTTDGGGVVRAALNPIEGAANIARFLAGVAAKYPGGENRLTLINGEPALAVVQGGENNTVFHLGIADGRIATVDAVRNPSKFHGLRPRPEK